MRKECLPRLILLLAILSPQLFAKGATSKIVIQETDLKGAIVITDPNILANFNIWSGAGTFTTSSGVTTQGHDGFIIDWPRGVAAEHVKGSARYQVSFYAKLPYERLLYVVFYEYDPATNQGYVYLPGKTDQWYQLNVSSLLRGVEGKWFFASEEWEKVANPLITKAKETAGSNR